MSSPFEKLFGGGGGSSDMMLPMMMMALKGPTETPAPPQRSPMGSPSTYKRQAPSFVGSAGVAPQQQQVGGKTLLGQ